MDTEVSPEAYDDVLAEYFHTGSEETLYRASLLSQSCIESGLGPEDIIALHFESLERVLAGRTPMERARATGDAHQFLLEVMIAYGVKYREYLEIKLQEALRDGEARAELERQRTLDAERLEQERADILATIAHELRTPLTAAMGQIELATRSLTRGQMERVPPLLGSAREALRRLSRLSADLVEVTRGGSVELSYSQQPLDALVAQAYAWASSAASEKGVSLAVEGELTGVQVLVDPDAMLSVLGNLLSNAIRYTPTGGRVVLRYGLERELAWVAVQDTGIGMPPEVQARIFEKFYRGPVARAVDAQGLGLGLALVKQLVHEHGGRVEVASAPGQGSTFRVVFPVRAEAAREEQHGTEA